MTEEKDRDREIFWDAMQECYFSGDFPVSYLHVEKNTLLEKYSADKKRVEFVEAIRDIMIAERSSNFMLVSDDVRWTGDIMAYILNFTARNNYRIKNSQQMLTRSFERESDMVYTFAFNIQFTEWLQDINRRIAVEQARRCKVLFINNISTIPFMTPKQLVTFLDLLRYRIQSNRRTVMTCGAKSFGDITQYLTAQDGDSGNILGQFICQQI